MKVKANGLMDRTRYKKRNTNESLKHCYNRKKTFYISIDIQKYLLLGSLRHPIDNDSPSVSLSAKR